MKYFLHDSNSFNDEKVSELYINFGYEGLGLFYTILEKLALQEKPVKTIVLKAQLNVGKKLEKCWNFMESLQLISSNNGETFNKQLLNNGEKFQIKKEKTKERVLEWRKNQILTENVTRYERDCNAPKVNKSKVNKSKVNIRDVAEPLSDYQLCLDFWLKDFHPDFTFGGQQGKALKSIIIKISRVLEDNGTASEKISIADTFKLICLKLPEWYKGKDLPVIDSKFNEVITEIKTSNNGTTKNNNGKPVSKYAPTS